MTLRHKLARFRDREEGNLTVEAVILLPLLIVMFVAMWVLFDYFRAHSVAGKTAYTVGDMISRETNYITPGYMDGALDLVNLMNGTYAEDSALRVSVISFDGDANRLRLEWSETAGAGYAALTEDALNAMRARIPAMPEGLHMILVETRSTYDAGFTLGPDGAEIATFVTTVPRFAPQVLWQG